MLNELARPLVSGPGTRPQFRIGSHGRNPALQKFRKIWWQRKRIAMTSFFALGEDPHGRWVRGQIKRAPCQTGQFRSPQPGS